LVGRTTLKQTLGSQKSDDWMPGVPQNLGSRASKQSGARPASTPDSAVSPDADPVERKVRLPLHAWGSGARRRVGPCHAP
jgi:hypothetical protein